MKQNYSSIRKTVYIFIFTLLFFVPQIALAKTYGMHRGVRPLGMGGAFTAVADDHNAIFYNPAGLAQIDGFGLGVINPFIAVSENSLDLVDELSDASDSDDGDDSNTEEVNEVLQNYLGENNSINITATPYVGFNIMDYGVMISPIGNVDIDISIQNPVWPEAHISGKVDTGAIIGAGAPVPVVAGLKVGAALKFIQRESFDEVYTAVDIADNDEDIEDKIEDAQKKGSGASIDVGVLYSVNNLPFTDFSIEDIPFTDLDIAFTVLNFPSMDFGDASDTKTQYNAGATFKHKFGILKIKESIDYIDITGSQSSDGSITNKFHLGVEASIPVLSLRAGLNQGYYTAGATLNFSVLRLDIATFGEEAGAYAGQKEDRQLAAQLSIGWDW